MMSLPDDSENDSDHLVDDEVVPVHHARIVLMGATLAGDRGSEATLRAAVGRLGELSPGVHLSLLSARPGDDGAELSRTRDLPIDILSFSPVQMVLALPWALLAAGLRKCRLGFRWMLPTQALKAIAQADVAIDLAGIGFMDGRYRSLVHDVLSVLIPRCLGVEGMKYAQSVGPLRSPLHRTLARWTLSRVDTLVTRGSESLRHVEELSLPAAVNVQSAADATFATTAPTAEDRAAIEPFLQHPIFAEGGAKVVAVAPSALAERSCRDHGIDYLWHLAQFIDELTGSLGYRVLLVPHAFRQGSDGGADNDLPICRRLHELLERKDRCLLVDRPPNAPQMRELIGACGFVVTSSFGAMAAALSRGVPPLVIAWSHQYAETLGLFGLPGHHVACQDLSVAALRRMFKEIESHQDAIRQQIGQRLPAVTASAMENARLATSLLNESLARKRAKATASHRAAVQSLSTDVATARKVGTTTAD